MPVEQPPAPAASMSSEDAAKKVGALLDGHTDHINPVEPSTVQPMEAPAGLANMGERLVGQNKEASKERRRWAGPEGSAIYTQHTKRNSSVLTDVRLEGEQFKVHPGAWPKIQGTSLYVANKLIGDSRISRDTPLNHLDLYSAYKSTPHAPASMFLKYLVHRINHVEDYEDPAEGRKLDAAFKELVQKGGAAEKNGHVSIQDLHEWTDRHATTVVPQLLAEKQRMQMDVARGVGLNVRSINGEPHVALTRGLSSSIMENEHPLSSHADTVDTGFGSDMHHAWVPLKDLWFAYDLDRTERSHNHMGPEDEYLISNTGTRYEAQPYDVKKGRIKRWAKEAPYVYDDMSDETLAGLVGSRRGADGTASTSNHDVVYTARNHPNAGPKVYEAMQGLWNEQGGIHSIPAGKPPIGSFGYKWYPREEVMKAAALPNSKVDAAAWFRNPNLTPQDLEVLGSKLFLNQPARADSYIDEATEQMLHHPAMNSHVLERMWKSQHGSPWMTKLLESPLATNQMREDAIEVAKFNPFGETTTPYKLMQAVTDNPHHTPEQAMKVYEWAISRGLFRKDPGIGGHRDLGVLTRAKLPPEEMVKLYDRHDELLQKGENNLAVYMRGGTPAFTEDEQAEQDTLKAITHNFVTYNPQADVIAQVAASKPGRVEARLLLNRAATNGFLEPELQATLINEVAHLYGKGTPLPGSTRQPVVDYLEKLASKKKLSQETISYLANYNDEMVRDILFRNKSVTPEQLREAHPKGQPFTPESAFGASSFPDNFYAMPAAIAAAYYRRKQHDEKRLASHFIKPLPQDLAKSSSEDMWRAMARSWLTEQSTKGFYSIVHKDIADGALRDMAIEPQFTDEVLDGEAVFARPATPENLTRLQREAGPDDVVLYFESPVEPKQHTDGSLYWTSRVPCDTIQMADLGDEPLAKMHTPLTFPKLGVGDDRRETKLVTEPGQRKTFLRAAAAQGIRENYVTVDKTKGNINRDLKQNPALRREFISRDAKKMGKEDNAGVMYDGIAGIGHPGHGIPREQRDSIPGAGTGQSAMSAAYAPSSTPRRKSNPVGDAAYEVPSYLPMIAHHEDLHRVFARVQHIHGEKEKEMLVRNLIHVLPQELQSAVMKHLYYAQPKFMTGVVGVVPEEEAITELTSYLNTAPARDSFHAKQQHSPEQQRIFHDKMKRAYRLLLAVSPTVDENWLHQEKPWLHSGKALKKFHEPQSGTGLSAAEAHEVLKGSLKLSKSHPDLVTDPNAFAFAFETDPTLMDAIDNRHWEMELRKMGVMNEFPTAAANFMKEFQKRTVHNGFDEFLGRYHNTTGKSDEGTLIVMSPRIKAWSDKPTVALDWIKALKPGNGDGHRSMKFITDLADKHGVSVELHVGNEGQGGFKTSPKSMLHKFYKKHGFAKRGPFEKDILVRHSQSHPVVEQGETLKLGSTMRVIKKSEVDFVLPSDKVLDSGEESAAKAMLGHRKDHETALKAARFLVGRKEQVDEDMFRVALSVFDGDFERAALIAVGLTDSEANLKALRAALKLGEFSHESTELSKNEPGTPHIESVNPGAPDAAPTADEVKRGVTAGLVQPLKLGGKHSKGSMAVRDPKTGSVWLLKPGAGKASPAAGVRDGSASQSAREAAFWHCMDRVGLGNYGPKADLLEVNGGQVAAMKLLGTQWKSLDEQNRKVDGWAREILQPYLDRGDVHRLAALLWVLGETDAHGQNLMTHAEAIALIDHGSAFAGPNFNPGRDSKSFTPYFLRVFAPTGYSKKKPEDRIEGLPVLTPAGDIALKKWVHGIDPSLISETMGSHGIGKVEQEAVLERLSDLQHHEGARLSRYVNELWAGVVAPPHLRSQP